MELGEKQELFAECLGMLLVYGKFKGYKFRIQEGFIDPVRRYKGQVTTLTQAQYVHLLNGQHPKKLAIDIMFFHDDGRAIENSDHPVYKDMGEYWESLNPLCRNLRNINDGNHFEVMGS